MAESSTKFHILLVEDEPVIRELVSSMLSDGTVNVVCAENGIEGLKLARTRAFQPHPDGRGAAEDGRGDGVPHPQERAVHGERPALHAHGQGEKADVEIATKAGADGYIHKPFRSADLMDLVERLRSAPQPS